MDKILNMFIEVGKYILDAIFKGDLLTQLSDNAFFRFISGALKSGE